MKRAQENLAEYYRVIPSNYKQSDQSGELHYKQYDTLVHYLPGNAEGFIDQEMHIPKKCPNLNDKSVSKFIACDSHYSIEEHYSGAYGQSPYMNRMDRLMKDEDKNIQDKLWENLIILNDVCRDTLILVYRFFYHSYYDKAQPVFFNLHRKLFSFVLDELSERGSPISFLVDREGSFDDEFKGRFAYCTPQYGIKWYGPHENQRDRICNMPFLYYSMFHNFGFDEDQRLIQVLKYGAPWAWFSDYVANSIKNGFNFFWFITGSTDFFVSGGIPYAFFRTNPIDMKDISQLAAMTETFRPYSRTSDRLPYCNIFNRYGDLVCSTDIVNLMNWPVHAAPIFGFRLTADEFEGCNFEPLIDYRFAVKEIEPERSLDKSKGKLNQTHVKGAWRISRLGNPFNFCLHYIQHPALGPTFFVGMCIDSHILMEMPMNEEDAYSIGNSNYPKIIPISFSLGILKKYSIMFIHEYKVEDPRGLSRY